MKRAKSTLSLNNLAHSIHASIALHHQRKPSTLRSVASSSLLPSAHIQPMPHFNPDRVYLLERQIANIEKML